MVRLQDLLGDQVIEGQRGTKRLALRGLLQFLLWGSLWLPLEAVAGTIRIRVRLFAAKANRTFRGVVDYHK